MYAMHRAVVGLAILVTGCTSNASLEVKVEHDPDIVAVVAKTTVSIYDQPGLTCAAIEFGDVPDDQLLGALAAEASDGQPLIGIPRTVDKVIVARGYATDGMLVSAGCLPLGVVDGDLAVTIETVPTATVAVGLNMAEPRGVVVATTDAVNASIDKREIYWRLFGAAGTSADGAKYNNISEGVWEPKLPTCTSSGDATIHPMPPLLPGGFELQVRVSWATKQPPLFSSFTQIDKSSVTVSTLTGSKIVTPCALQRHAGTTTIACLSGATTVDIYGYTPQDRALVKVGQQSLPTNADDWVALVAVDDAGGDLSAYAISDQGAWQAIGTAPAAAAGTSWCVASPLSPLRCTNYATTTVTVVPACGDQPAYLLGASTDVGSNVHLRKQPIRGGAPTEYDLKDGVPVGAGCLTELQPDGSARERQAVVLNIPKSGQLEPFTTAVFACSATKSPCSVPLPSVGQAVAFTSGTERQLIGTTFDATGAQLARWVVEPASAKGGTIGPKDRLIERSRQVAASSPRQLVSGQFDADGVPDLMWSFATRTDIEFQIAYAREVLGAPLSALDAIGTPAGLTPQPIGLFATDFNGDKFDELVFVFATTVLATTATTLVVVPTGLPYANPPSATDDPTCQ